MKVGICKLCLENKPLLKKSHILPKFLFKPLRDEHRQFIKTTTKNFDRTKHIGDAMYEYGILCLECDNSIIGSLETYANEVIFGGKQSSKTTALPYLNENS